jgi:hypothetical protein
MAAKKKAPPNPVTPQGRDAFDLYARKWQEALSLNDWRIEQSSKPAAKANMAEVHQIDLAARLATYRIGADFGGTPVTDMSIEQIACHEIWHVRLHELIELCRNPASTDEQIAGAEHAVIHSAVRLLVPVEEPTFILPNQQEIHAPGAASVRKAKP